MGKRPLKNAAINENSFFFSSKPAEMLIGTEFVRGVLEKYVRMF